MRLAHVGFGDFREAVHRLDEGAGEVYTSQHYTVRCLREIVSERGPVTAISLATESYDEELEPGLRVVGLPFNRSAGAIRRVVEAVASSYPTHLITRPLILKPLQWAVAHGVRVLPTTASSFEQVTLRHPRAWLEYRRLVRLLDDMRIAWVCNHNVNSTRSLARAGVRPAKLIPWDMPPAHTPAEWPPKAARTGNGIRLMFVGKVSEAKGVGDLLHALAMLRASGREVTLSAAGSGDVERFEKLAGVLKIEDAVSFLGNLPHDRVVPTMAEHDAVLVPSRHEYPEGLPFVIYEAFCSRSPPVVSDHPMFRGKVVDGVSGVVHRAGDPEDLAAAIERLTENPVLYARLSEQSQVAWEALQCPVKWRELINHWLEDGPEDRAWLAAHSLASGTYDAHD